MPREIMCPGRQCAPADNVPRRQFAPGDNMPRRHCAPEGNVPRKEKTLRENMPWRKCAPEIMCPRDNVPWKTLLLFGPFWSGLAPFIHTKQNGPRYILLSSTYVVSAGPTSQNGVFLSVFLSFSIQFCRLLIG